jgi:hypothetical protein
MRTKVASIAFLWVGLAVTAWWLWNPWIDLALVLIGLGVTWHVARLPSPAGPLSTGVERGRIR